MGYKVLKKTGYTKLNKKYFFLKKVGSCFPFETRYCCSLECVLEVSCIRQKSVDQLPDNLHLGRFDFELFLVLRLDALNLL